MRICDRDGAKATESITFARTHEVFDLCETCTEEIKEYMFNPKLKMREDKRGRKRNTKKSETAKK